MRAPSSSSGWRSPSGLWRDANAADARSSWLQSQLRHRSVEQCGERIGRTRRVAIQRQRHFVVDARVSCGLVLEAEVQPPQWRFAPIASHLLAARRSCRNRESERRRFACREVPFASQVERKPQRLHEHYGRKQPASKPTAWLGGAHWALVTRVHRCGLRNGIAACARV